MRVSARLSLCEQRALLNSAEDDDEHDHEISQPLDVPSCKKVANADAEDVDHHDRGSAYASQWTSATKQVQHQNEISNRSACQKPYACACCGAAMRMLRAWAF